jgi:hypothetical protein
MAKPRILSRRAALSLRELQERTKISRSTLSRMPDEQLQALSLAIEDGSWSSDWCPSPRKTEEAANPLLDALNAAESALIRAHFALVSVRWDLKESNPEVYEKLGGVLEITRPYVEEPRRGRGYASVKSLRSRER